MDASSTPRQLPLGLVERPILSYENFVVGRNSELIGCLQSASWDFLYLRGRSGSGKSHLLQALCEQSRIHNIEPLYLPLKEVFSLGSALLHGAERYDLIVVDDIHILAGDDIWEEGMFHLYNALKSSGRKLVVADCNPPEALKIKLPDLYTRLRWGQLFEVKSLKDEEKLVALHQRAADYGFELSHDVTSYLLRHFSRDEHQLFELLYHINQESLVEKRRVTIPLIKQIISNSS